MGFLMFVQSVLSLTPRSPCPPTDLIVVLTGGQERIHAGLTLLSQGCSNKLLISGVHANVTLENILLEQKESFDAFKRSIILGRKATDTQSNASEAAYWVKKTGAQSICLITSNYHIPRSLVVFNRLLPHTRIEAYAVEPPSVNKSNWMKWPGTIGLLFWEYNKYLVSFLYMGF